MPCSPSTSRRSVSAGSKVRCTMLVPPQWNTGLAKQLRPPMWNSGIVTRFTDSSPRRYGPDRLTAFHVIAPCVSIAPLGRPVVPDVYMMHANVSWSLSPAMISRSVPAAIAS